MQDRLRFFCVLFVTLVVILWAEGRTMKDDEYLSNDFIDTINSKAMTWTAARYFHEETPKWHIKSLTGIKKMDKSQWNARDFLKSKAKEIKHSTKETENHFSSPLNTANDNDYDYDDDPETVTSQITDNHTTETPPIIESTTKTISKKNNLLPDAFDSRDNWPECADVIGSVQDQGGCGSCWAVAAVETMRDRLCIATKGAVKTPISAQDLMTCCKECGDGCDGGLPPLAFYHWFQHGITTGGGYRSEEGCKSYFFKSCIHMLANGTRHNFDKLTGPCPNLNGYTPKCRLTCDDGSSRLPHITRGGFPYVLDNNETAIQMEIMRNGPVEAGYTVYQDFIHYNSGVYQYTHGKELGGHAVKIIGWGLAPPTANFTDGVPYWIAVNSWNTDWGQNGTFNILRGHNECDIEEEMVAALPAYETELFRIDSD